MVGTIFFVLVFMISMGTMAYASGLQTQASQAQQQAQLTLVEKGAETLAYSAGQTGLTVANTGPDGVSVNHIVLKFPNGTVYALSAATSLPSGGREQVSALVPAGVCSPGSATCLSKFNQIVAGIPAGSEVGLVTSMGNSFWYTAAQSQQGGSGTATVDRVLADTWTTGTGAYGSTTLAVTLAPNTNYVFYVFTAITPSTGVEHYNFEVHALAVGTTLVIACAPMAYPLGGGSQPTNCVSAAGTPIASTNSLGFGVAPPVYQTPGIFGTVAAGSAGGTLQIDFACTQSCGSVAIKAGSFMVVQQAP